MEMKNFEFVKRLKAHLNNLNHYKSAKNAEEELAEEV